jgi:enterochelin esterase family protein
LYPFVLFHDGGNYISYAGAPTILDNLIAAGAIPPVIAAFVSPIRRNWEYHLNHAFTAFCADELPAFVSAHYPGMTPDPARRAVIGASSGGLVSVFTAWSRPDVYGAVGAFSCYTSFQHYRILKLIEAAPVRPVRFHLVAGHFERHLWPGYPEGSPGDLLDNSRRLAAVLDRKGYTHRAAEYYDGHNWGFWADHLPEALRWLLGAPADGRRQ